MKKHQPFDIRRRGFTELEALHVGPAKSSTIAPLWVRLVLIAAVAVILIHLFVVPLLPLPEAHAEPIKTNADYCREWNAGVWPAVSHDEARLISSFCAEYL